MHLQLFATPRGLLFESNVVRGLIIRIFLYSFKQTYEFDLLVALFTLIYALLTKEKFECQLL